MEYIKYILKSDIFWNFVSVITSFIIVKITLNSEQKNNRYSIIMQEKQQMEQQQIDEKLHNENVRVTKAQERANLLPFLKLERDIKMAHRGENYYFPLIITNLGNSGAFDVKIEYKVEKDICLCYVDKHEVGERIDYYQYNGYLYDNVLPVRQSGVFTISLCSYRNGKCLSLSDKAVAGEVHFSILFKDSLYNQYRQKYMFQYQSSCEYGRIESYLPQLVEESGVC